MWNECSCVVVWTFFGAALLRAGITDVFQSCGHCWVFQICWHVEYNTLTASSFRIWSSLAGIPSPPLALLGVMLPKAHKMSGSRWVITPLWLSRSLRLFLYSSSVYSCHLFLISSASVGPYHFCPLLYPSLHEMFPYISNFLEEISSFSHLVFSSISLHYSRNTFSLLAVVWKSPFSWVYLSPSPLPFASLPLSINLHVFIVENVLWDAGKGCCPIGYAHSLKQLKSIFPAPWCDSFESVFL